MHFCINKQVNIVDSFYLTFHPIVLQTKQAYPVSQQKLSAFYACEKVDYL